MNKDIKEVAVMIVAFSIFITVWFGFLYWTFNHNTFAIDAERASIMTAKADVNTTEETIDDLNSFIRINAKEGDREAAIVLKDTDNKEEVIEYYKSKGYTVEIEEYKSGRIIFTVKW